jgi:hypothetical protein
VSCRTSDEKDSKHVRRSVTLPGSVAKQVESIASRRRLSDNRVLVELIELGIETSNQQEKAFFELAERFRVAKDPGDSKRFREELAHFAFADGAHTPSGHSSEPLKRKMSECLALLPKKSNVVMDSDFAKDVEAGIESHREPLEPRHGINSRFECAHCS